TGRSEHGCGGKRGGALENAASSEYVVHGLSSSSAVIPAKAGIHNHQPGLLGPGSRGLRPLGRDDSHYTLNSLLYRALMSVPSFSTPAASSFMVLISRNGLRP